MNWLPQVLSLGTGLLTQLFDDDEDEQDEMRKKQEQANRKQRQNERLMVARQERSAKRPMDPGSSVAMGGTPSVRNEALARIFGS